MAGPSRVGELRLRARLPAALAEAAPAVRTRLERETIVGVLEALERQVHATFGADAIIHVRHLSLAWALSVDALGDVAALARLADDLARDLFAAVAQQPPPDRLRPRDAIIVAFADAHHQVAAALADAADGHAAHWSTAALGDAATAWSALIAEGAVAITTTIAWLTRMERVEAALALADEPSLAAVAAAAPHLAGVVALVRARRAPVGAAAPSRTPPDADADAPHAPRADAERAADGPTRTTRPSSAPPTAATPATPAAAATPATATTPGAPAVPTAPAARRASSVAALAHRTDPAREPDAGATIAGHDDDRHAEAPARDTGRSVDTAAAGLFFLIGRVLEIELAERLWAAGVDEARALAAIARPLVDDDDPAWAWFGGGFERPPVAPTIEPWAAAEVREGVTHALGHRLVRFGVATTPATLAQQLDELARSAPRAAHGPGLASLIDFATAALTTIVAARLRRPPSHALLRSLVRRPGRLVRTDDALHVILPATALDIEHRRAGLDQDPGYVPWLRRRVTLEYVGLAEL